MANGRLGNQTSPPWQGLGEASEASGTHALKKLAAICAKGEHCTGEADEKMRRWGVDEQTRTAIIAKLVEGKFIDDERYTRFFVHDKIRFNNWGRRKIEQALMQKRVSKDIIDSVLDQVDDSEYTNVLRPLMAKRMSTVKGKSDYERAMKTIKWAVSRGFTMDIIRKCVGDGYGQTED